jgi:hypothetical protein
VVIAGGVMLYDEPAVTDLLALTVIVVVVNTVLMVAVAPSEYVIVPPFMAEVQLVPTPVTAISVSEMVPVLYTHVEVVLVIDLYCRFHEAPMALSIPFINHFVGVTSVSVSIIREYCAICG